MTMIKKKILVVIVNLLWFIMGFTVLHGLSGRWFDAENLLRREDYEIYNIPLWQYVMYYFILTLFLIIHALLIIYYNKDKSKWRKFLSNIIYITVFIILYIVTIIIPVYFY